MTRSSLSSQFKKQLEEVEALLLKAESILPQREELEENVPLWKLNID